MSEETTETILVDDEQAPNPLGGVHPDSLERIEDIITLAQGPLSSSLSERRPIVIPDRHKLAYIEPDTTLSELPSYRHGNFKAHTAIGFIDYIKRNKGEVPPMIAVDLLSDTFTASLDWHKSEAEPDRCTFSATYTLQHSRELLQWIALTEKPLSQCDFADFIEDNRLTIAEPDAASLLEIVMDLQQTSDSSFKSKVNATTGGISMTYVDDPQLNTSASLEVPKSLTLRLPLYRGSDAIDVTCNLRYRVTNGTMSIHVTLPGLEHTLAHALETERQLISQQLEVDVVEGDLTDAL